MPNNTFEDYKKAVKKKYEKEKNSEHSFYLEIPTRGKLRTLCWELFQQQNRTQDDLSIFNSLLGLSFDINRRNKFDEQIDKFRPIENFFKGETDPSNVDAVNMAAILVDFKARPFNKFRIQELFEDEDEIDNEKNSELSNTEIDQNNNAGILESFLDKKEREKVSGREEKISGIEVIKPKPINSFVDIHPKKNLQSKFLPVGKRSILSFIGVLCLIGLITYYVLPDKKCMQWSGDHYETVDCDLRIEGLGQSANIEIIDPTLIHLKKIKVCDTTTFFDKNGDGVIWYAKTANGVEFFNAHGRHPENNRPLKPVTHYILSKYAKK